MEKCVVLIPVYKEIPSLAEQASFKQTLSVLFNHPICLFTHPACNIDWYKQTAKEIGKEFMVEFFDKSYFSSVEGYNNLCFSSEFYTRYLEYEYMLICQLDVWVFRDELNYWCNKGYDYIGAPIFYAYNSKSFTDKVLGIGNGGFCLRRIAHCLKMLNSDRNKVFLKPFPLIKLYWNYFLYSNKFKTLKGRLLLLPTVIAKCFGKYNTMNHYIKRHVNEDMIYGSWATCSWGNHAIIPTVEEATSFSFEVHPEMLYHQNGNKLPFGCHAFAKWNYESFWSKYIKF